MKDYNILLGSSIGLAAGVTAYIILSGLGIYLGSLESSFIIGLPALLGLITSFSIS